jgi:acyl-CoA synthetase (AMP-forming)/AMP-acid ligase II
MTPRISPASQRCASTAASSRSGSSPAWWTTECAARPHHGAGDRVALWFHNSFNWLAAFLALNALGRVSVPINTRLTAAELQVILRDVRRARADHRAPLSRRRNYLDEAIGALDALDAG